MLSTHRDAGALCPIAYAKGASRNFQGRQQHEPEGQWRIQRIQGGPEDYVTGLASGLFTLLDDSPFAEPLESVGEDDDAMDFVEFRD